MSKIVTIHSVRKGRGKSQIAANMAVQWAGEGQRIALIDANILAPTMKGLFNRMDWETPSLEDYLLDRCNIEDAAYDVTNALSLSARDAKHGVRGQLFLLSSVGEPADIFGLLHAGFPTERFSEGLADLDSHLALDKMIVECPAGLAEETLTFLALSDSLGIVMFLDQREYQGTGATLEVARRLDVHDVAILVNDVPAVFDYDQVRSEVSETYDCPVTVLPHSEELLTMAGRGIFIQEYPEHPLSNALRQAAATLTAWTDSVEPS
ncbi:MAG TPA: MinD/ParA family protein [Aggregatilineales bacterium]|nr:MinD/ParA family protein [Aggregatilineales bacterium]